MTVDEHKMYTWLFMEKKINIIYNTTQVFTFDFFFIKIFRMFDAFIWMA